MTAPTNRLPDPVTETLETFVAAAKQAFGHDLRSVILYGSAAEGHLRASSDVNMLLVLKRFDRTCVDQVRERFRTAHAAIRLEIMFLLESEVAQASEAFAVKFADILARHRVLFGDNPLTATAIPRDATIRRLRQVLLNLRLRLRERYALVSLREEQLVPIIADHAGPLRACAATLLRLEGTETASPKEALRLFAASLPGGPWQPVLDQISAAREDLRLAPGCGATLMFQLMELTTRIEARAAKL
jgi:predicted nucleotidyltransferase